MQTLVHHFSNQKDRDEEVVNWKVLLMAGNEGTSKPTDDEEEDQMMQKKKTGPKGWKLGRKLGVG